VDQQRPLATLYGCIVGLAAQGPQVVRQVLLAQVGCGAARPPPRHPGPPLPPPPPRRLLAAAAAAASAPS
jgi:hypothetical protein